MNAKEHPLNKAAEARFTRDNLPRAGGLALFDLFWEGLILENGEQEGDEPESLRLATAVRPECLPNSLALLEQELTPEDVLEMPLEELADTALSVLQCVPPQD